ncbi:hypothetical protein BGZ94_007598 [Podila epigama]|nr:hypothetical protein BGZ94_007598 [Podila epigama]
MPPKLVIDEDGGRNHQRKVTPAVQLNDLVTFFRDPDNPQELMQQIRDSIPAKSYNENDFLGTGLIKGRIKQAPFRKIQLNMPGNALTYYEANRPRAFLAIAFLEDRFRLIIRTEDISQVTISRQGYVMRHLTADFVRNFPELTGLTGQALYGLFATVIARRKEVDDLIATLGPASAKIWKETKFSTLATNLGNSFRLIDLARGPRRRRVSYTEPRNKRRKGRTNELVQTDDDNTSGGSGDDADEDRDYEVDDNGEEEEDVDEIQHSDSPIGADGKDTKQEGYEGYNDLNTAMEDRPSRDRLQSLSKQGAAVNASRGRLNHTSEPQHQLTHRDNHRNDGQGSVDHRSIHPLSMEENSSSSSLASPLVKRLKRDHGHFTRHRMAESETTTSRSGLVPIAPAPALRKLVQRPSSSTNPNNGSSSNNSNSNNNNNNNNNNSNSNSTTTLTTAINNSNATAITTNGITVTTISSAKNKQISNRNDHVNRDSNLFSSVNTDDASLKELMEESNRRIKEQALDLEALRVEVSEREAIQEQQTVYMQDQMALLFQQMDQLHQHNVHLTAQLDEAHALIDMHTRSIRDLRKMILLGSTPTANANGGGGGGGGTNASPSDNASVNGDGSGQLSRLSDDPPMSGRSYYSSLK